MKVKIAYNDCFGGFGLSEKGFELYKKLGGTAEYDRDIPRSDPLLIEVIETLGKEANGDFADLQIAEVEKGNKYRIEEYDGNESVMEPDDYQWEIA